VSNAKNRRRGLGALGLLALIGIGIATARPAQAGIAFGVRGGYVNVDANAFLGSGKIGGTPLVGLQAVIPIVPVISLVVAGEQTTKSFDFGNATVGDLHVRGRAKWTDQALYAAARARVPGVVGMYGGVGVGMHRQKTDLSGVVEVTLPKAGSRSDPRFGGLDQASPVVAGNPLNDFVNRAQKEATDLSWHGLIGVEISIPVAPLSVFAEGRIDDIQGKAPHSLAAYAGVNLQLP
jgi:hypothetical protein